METAERSRLTGSVLLVVALAAACAPSVASSPTAAALPGLQAPAQDVSGDPGPGHGQLSGITVVSEPELVSADGRLLCAGPVTQGGAIACRTRPGAVVRLDARPAAVAGEDGLVIVGLRRDSPPEVTVSVGEPGSANEERAEVSVRPRSDTVSKFTMECSRIAPQTPAQKRHAEISWVKKDRALNTFAPPVSAFGFVKPADGPYSSPFGAVRTYVPKTAECEGSTSVHNGQDIAVGVGTEIRAPMGGTVILADPDLYFEGGSVFIDHGSGLVSVLMHMSRIDVTSGAVVRQGDLLGLSGATGRVTGPHLHWAIRYRDVHSDDRGTDIWLDPVLMMNLSLPPP